ncbi:MAG: PAS domain S-box protein [Leptolyngbyaceae cyanobacterium MO_188.B28]|nr:PAS domain S-box protein [Leptolyngbyaceae cyanobacterium MO_188.B28]
MAFRVGFLAGLLKSRLSRQIVLWVFASILAIEGIILIPSVYRRERELLAYLKLISSAKASGILGDQDLPIPEQELLNKLELILKNPVVTGGVLYRVDGSLVGSLGESPELTFDRVIHNPKVDFLNRSNHRYDAVWAMSPLDGRYVLIIRHDASTVKREVFLFIGRIAGLVLIISIFVTLATMIVLERILIASILTLRRDLLRAGEAVSQDIQGDLLEFASVRGHRQDELGDVAIAFDQMFRQITAAIAERKRVEAELRLSEEKFSKAFRCSPNAITLSTLQDGHLVEVNDSFLKLLGGQLEDVIGNSTLELDLWTEPTDRADLIQTLQQTGFIRNQEYRLSTRTGAIKTVLYSAERIKIGGQDCILSVINDITERKQAEEALKDSEKRFRTLVEQAVDAFFVINAEGKLIDVNQQACASLGYTREELVSLTVPDIQQELTMDGFFNLWRRLAPDAPITSEGVHRRKDGSKFPVEVRIGLLKFAERQLVLALARDISERKQAEKALARLAEIGELAAMIVHEVRSPLTTVVMGLNSFKRMDLPERAKIRLGLALEESERLQRLLNEILLYAKNQALELTDLDLNEFITDLLDAVQETPTTRDRQIKFVPSPSPTRVQGDRDKLKQVFINLVSNACEAVGPGEEILWRIDQRADEKQVWVQVHNGGEPIPPEVLPKLTTPFFTTKSTGNGLGLAITKRIVESHGGELTIESAAAMGTTVTVSLPWTADC